MIDHKPWVGSTYKAVGINGQRIAIVGHSHWGDHDHAGVSIEVVSRVISGGWKIHFFTPQQ